MYQLRTLGTLDLRSTDGTPVHSLLAQPKRSAILCYLAIATPRGFHRRERVAAFFWPEHDTEHARHSLRQALHAIRNSLGEDAILARGDDEIALSPAKVMCDVAELEEAFAQERWADVVELHRGLLLDGFYVPDCTEFDEWVEDQRERLRERAETAAWKCVEAALAKRDTSAALGWGRRAIELAPTDEEPLRRFMRLADAVGDPAAGLSAYEKFRVRLKRAYDLDTSAETDAIVGRLQAAHSASQPLLARVDAAAPLPGKAEPGGEAPPSTRPSRKPRRFARPVVRAAAAGLLLVLSGAAYVALHAPFGTLAGRGKLDSPVQLVLADFDPVNVDTIVADALKELIWADLQQSRSIRTLSPRLVASALERMQRAGARLDSRTALELAQREGASGVLAGELRRVAGGYLLVVNVTARDSVVLLVERESTRDSTDLIGAAERLSHRLRTRVGESFRSVKASEPLPKVTTASLPALVSYAAALRANQAEHFDRAISLLEDALSRDTAFAMAWRLLAAVERNRWNATAALEAGEHAFRYRSRLPELERLKVEALFFSNQADYAAEEYARERILEFEPGELANLADLRLRQRRFAEAESLARQALDSVASRNGPSLVAVSNLVEAQLAQGKVAAAESALARYRVPRGSMISRQVRYAKRDYAGAWQIADSLSRTTPELVALPAHIAMLQGRLVDARRLGAGDTNPFWLRLELRYGARPDSVYREAEALIRRAGIDTLPPQGLPDLCELVSLLAELGRTEAARDYTAAWNRVGGLRHRASADQCAGAIALAEGRFGDAAAAFLRWHQAPFATSEHSYNRGLYEAADALDRGMVPDTATRLYERAVNHPFGLPNEVLWYPFALQRLGELHASRGHVAQAIDYYTRLLELWQHADPPLQRRLKAVKAARDSLLAISG